MKAPSVPSKCERFCVLDAKNRPVEVFDRAEWSRWMAENERIFRRTPLEETGVMITTRFRGVAEARTEEVFLFVTRITRPKKLPVSENKIECGHGSSSCQSGNEMRNSVTRQADHLATRRRNFIGRPCAA